MLDYNCLRGREGCQHDEAEVVIDTGARDSSLAGLASDILSSIPVAGLAYFSFLFVLIQGVASMGWLLLRQIQFNYDDVINRRWRERLSTGRSEGGGINLQYRNQEVQIGRCAV